MTDEEVDNRTNCENGYGELDDLLSGFSALPARDRAEIVIKAYCKSRSISRDSELDKIFEDWLYANALIVFETKALEDYFNLIVSENNDVAESRQVSLMEMKSQ